VDGCDELCPVGKINYIPYSSTLLLQFVPPAISTIMITFRMRTDFRQSRGRRSTEYAAKHP
jgi:hypothetical protein